MNIMRVLSVMKHVVIDNISADLKFNSIFSLIVLAATRKPVKCLSSLWLSLYIVKSKEG